MTDIFLVRHGHVPGILPERFRGRTELELTDRGKHEAVKTAGWLAQRVHPAAIYTSPLKRCIDTGYAIGQRCGISPEVLPTLNDIDYGQWQGLTHDEVALKWPNEWRRWHTTPQLMRFPNGESFTELVDRAANAIAYAIDQHHDDTIIMVSHDSVIRAILLLTLNQALSNYWRLAQEPCAINAITIEDDRCIITLLNQTAHLED